MYVGRKIRSAFKSGDEKEEVQRDGQCILKGDKGKGNHPDGVLQSKLGIHVVLISNKIVQHKGFKVYLPKLK